MAESENVDQYFEQDQNDANVVAVRKLQKIYKTKKKKTKVAVKNVSFGIPQGEVFGLLGELSTLDVSIISSCSQKFYVKGFSEADIYSAHIKLFSFFPHLIVD